MRKTKEKTVSENEEKWNKEEKKQTTSDPRLLSADEGKQAKEAKEWILRILSDALKKKESLLVEDPKEFGDQSMKCYYCPLITADLVKDLIQELEKVTFAKNTILEDDIEANAYVYSGSEDRTIHLCAAFWEMDPESRSRQGTIIHEVSHFLGYGHTVRENSDRVQKSPQSMLCPLTAYSVASAFTKFMDHPGTYRDGAYPCCGETSRDTVCEESWMAEDLRLLHQLNKLLREMSLNDTIDEETYTSGEEVDCDGEEVDSAGEEVDSDGEEVDNDGEEMDNDGEEVDNDGEEVDNDGEEVDSAGEEVDNDEEEMDSAGEEVDSAGEESNYTGVETDSSFEDMESSDVETDTAVEQTDIVLPMKRRKPLVKRQMDLIKIQINLLKTQTSMVNMHCNRLNKWVDMLKTRSDMMNTLAAMVDPD